MTTPQSPRSLPADMVADGPKDGARPARDQRAERAARALRANLAKRKAQARARAGAPVIPEADQASEHRDTRGADDER